jgi:hypothetical protein
MYPVLRNLKSTIALAVAVGALGVACGGGPVDRATPPVSSPSINQVLADVISPGLDHSFVFGKAQPPVEIQPGSKVLLRSVVAGNGLHVFALLSTAGSTAIFLLEDDPKVPWGTHLRPAQRTIFEQFAANPSMGDWLIMLDDVIVHETQDPIPLTAYRWPRADVEEYVACGIPKTGQNDCSRKFYLQAVTVILKKSGQSRGQ